MRWRHILYGQADVEVLQSGPSHSLRLYVSEWGRLQYERSPDSNRSRLERNTALAFSISTIGGVGDMRDCYKGGLLSHVGSAPVRQLIILRAHN